MVGAICVVVTCVDTWAAEKVGWDTTRATWVSSSDPPPCSATLLWLPEWMTPQLGWTKTLGARAAATGSPDVGSPKIAASSVPEMMFIVTTVPGGSVSA